MDHLEALKLSFNLPGFGSQRNCLSKLRFWFSVVLPCITDKESCLERKMPHRTRPMTALLVFTGLNVILVSTITPVYDFVCFLPYWERRREHRHQDRQAALTKDSR
ncbi:transmembrane protein [Salix suchowensis]|nr:transmembrane protein [Salix suchowensis]